MKRYRFHRLFPLLLSHRKWVKRQMMVSDSLPRLLCHCLPAVDSCRWRRDHSLSPDKPSGETVRVSVWLPFDYRNWTKVNWSRSVYFVEDSKISFGTTEDVSHRYTTRFYHGVHSDFLLSLSTVDFQFIISFNKGRSRGMYLLHELLLMTSDRIFRPEQKVSCEH